MAHITFYEKPGCGGNAKQKALLIAAGHTLEVRDLLHWRWTPSALLAFLEPLPVSGWFNRAAPDVKCGRIVPESLTAGAALALLLAQPLLIRRPLMEAGETRMAGFDTARVHAWVGLGPDAVASRAPRSLEGCAAATDGCAASPD
ncbi:thioredoxin domain-containing protein [Paraburkholderia caballeronis]|uniref:Nitrogenase-associated protein n=1 Tax=Paraburkholderia caballeronis TaxID=416943 RepID=A0A1H7FEF0_9BURK|nr:ArsC/Spx/MgsR family protein [Paraburkholderia caballeronis]PXW23994.1 nitrogenase-associated protein [Paraburkholderia caballeronis]PXW99758.1 nitrogenase-associated protein [Paraburkholderia caballeronis]RAJ96712.1 nitrogenase-associated protein [Paraburkholderia caballeronis]SEE76323.1 nitrogenase-associated protein [Paraburkholderia caballeronis]SEK21625.1 nitrogenase-associated protein [Paraburkholderia caballeronis]